jgi:hypothetical protein
MVQVPLPPLPDGETEATQLALPASIVTASVAGRDSAFPVVTVTVNTAADSFPEATDVGVTETAVDVESVLIVTVCGVEELEPPKLPVALYTAKT